MLALNLACRALDKEMVLVDSSTGFVVAAAVSFEMELGVEMKEESSNQHESQKALQTVVSGKGMAGVMKWVEEGAWRARVRVEVAELAGDRVGNQAKGVQPAGLVLCALEPVVDLKALQGREVCIACMEKGLLDVLQIESQPRECQCNIPKGDWFLKTKKEE